jgi:hypothetical protein
MAVTSLFTVQMTLGTDPSVQANADAIRAVVLLDYAKARGLDIYLPDHITVDPTKVGPAVQAAIKADFKTIVVNYRANIAAQTGAANQMATDTAAIQP